MGRKQGCWPGPTTSARGWPGRLPWGPPQEGALPDLPTRPPPTLLSLSVQARRSSDRPVPPRIPKTPVFGPKKRDPGPGTPISRPQPLTLTAVPQKSRHLPLTNGGVSGSGSSCLPPWALHTQEPWRPLLRTHGRALPSLGPHLLLRGSGEVYPGPRAQHSTPAFCGLTSAAPPPPPSGAAREGPQTLKGCGHAASGHDTIVRTILTGWAQRPHEQAGEPWPWEDSSDPTVAPLAPSRLPHYQVFVCLDHRPAQSTR